MPFAEIDKEILSGLRTKPMSIYEISRTTGRSWRTIRDHLRRLMELGKVECSDDAAGKLWRLKQTGFGVSGERQIIVEDLIKIARNRVDARELMYYDKVPYKFRLPLIEECGVIVPLHIFKTLRSVLVNKFSREKAEAILYDIGREHGSYIIEKVSEMLGGGNQSPALKLFELGVNVEGAKKVFSSIYESQGWFKVISIEFSRYSVTFKIKYSFESMAYSGAYPCSFTKGFLEGFIEGYLLEKDIRCEELRCIYKGEDYCEFRIGLMKGIPNKLEFLYVFS